MTVTTKTTTLIALLGLAACGGGTPSSFSSEDQALRSFAATDGDFSTFLNDGGTLSSRAGTATGIQLRFDGGETNLSDANVSIARNDDGELTASYNGQSYAFKSSDRIVEDDGTVYGYEFEADDGSTFSLFHFGGELDELLDGNGEYGTVVSVAGDLGPEGDTLYNRSFAAIGTETMDADLRAVSGTATFDAFARVDFYPAEDFINSGSSRNSLRGELTMTADFDAGEISGQMNNLTLQRPGEGRADIAGQVDFGAAGFDDNTFTGDVATNQALMDAGVQLNSDAGYTGAFFGPAAEEIHGVIDGTGTLDGVDVNAIGFFTQ